MTRRRSLKDLDDDIRDHLERETQDNIDRGMTPDDARAAAHRTFGNVALIKEDTRAVWIPVWFDQLSRTHATRSACCGAAPVSARWSS